MVYVQCIRRAVSFEPTAEDIFLLISSTSLVHERCPSIINPSDFALTFVGSLSINLDIKLSNL